jgi:hypothetical protein
LSSRREKLNRLPALWREAFERGDDLIQLAKSIEARVNLLAKQNSVQ